MKNKKNRRKPRTPCPELLYHFTCREHLYNILYREELRTTESNLSIKKENSGPRVVWLMDQHDPDQECIQGGPREMPASLLIQNMQGCVSQEIAEKAKRDELVTVTWANKQEFRFTIKPSYPEDIHYWPSWSRALGISPGWYNALAEGNNNPSTWWVSTRPIDIDDWIRIENTITGEVLMDVEDCFNGLISPTYAQDQYARFTIA
jgi:hypothetical protein